MLLDALDHGEDDLQKRRSSSSSGSRRQRILDALEHAMTQDADLLEDEEERADIEGAARRLRRAMEGDDHDEIHRRIEDLDLASKAFAGRRMDRSIVRALSGRAAAQVEAETEDARGIEPHLGQEPH